MREWMKHLIMMISWHLKKGMHGLLLGFFLLCGSFSLSAAPPEDPFLTIVKTVSYPDQVPAAIGDTVAFTVIITNTGTSVATAPWFLDIFPSGLVYEPGSSMVSLNQGQFVAGGDPTTGFALPSLNPSDTVTVTFRATVESFPLVTNQFQNIAEVIYCAGDGEGGCSPVAHLSDPVEVLAKLLDPIATVESCCLVHRTVHTLTITWDIPFANVLSYNIFFDGSLIAVVPGQQLLFFQTRLKHSCDADRFSVQADYGMGITTPIIPVRVK